MLTKEQVVEKIIGKKALPKCDQATAFAPSNIALCKYWGKRNQILNLPVTSSLSISLGDKGTNTEISISDQATDEIILNQQAVELSSPFATKLVAFLNLFRSDAHPRFKIVTENTIATGAGLASSASGFAALTKALNKLYHWQLPDEKLSIIARLGSGSACRSLWNGFVEWQSGEDQDGFDSHGIPLDVSWPELAIGLVIISHNEKTVSSRVAMQQTVDTSVLYEAWPKQVAYDLQHIKEAIHSKDFAKLGHHSEQNANAMHATLTASWPSMSYHQAETIQAMQRVWQLRKQGHAIYYTQDAGPNLKLLFLRDSERTVRDAFAGCEIV